MKTGCFFTARTPGLISIARRAPKGWVGPGLGSLAPGHWFRTTDLKVYRELYAKEILGVLDPKAIVARAQELAGDAEPVLLCWEKPPFTETNFCHRRLVADWLEQALGEAVDELSTAPSSGPSQLALKLDAPMRMRPPGLFGARKKSGAA